jgi:betaine-aldehyde dehydrogenase
MASLPSIEESLPKQKDLFYGGEWHKPTSGEYRDTFSPGNGQVIDKISHAGADDAIAAIKAAHEAFPKWKVTTPQQRATAMRKAASILRQHAAELALLDAYNTGNPVAEMLADANVAAAQFDYFAGLIPMLKGETIPSADDHFHYTVREPLGVVARIVAFNHPVRILNPCSV